MSLHDDLDLDSVNPDNLEKEMSGELLPEGLYVARLVGAKSINSASKGTPGNELTFEVVAGEYNGREVKETIWTSNNDRSRNRKILFLHRLGLLEVKEVDGQKRYAWVEGKSDWHDAIDGVNVVIDLAHEEFERKDDKGVVTGKGKRCNLRFGGIYSLDTTEKRVQEWLKTVTIPPSGGSSSGGSGGASGPTSPSTPRNGGSGATATATATAKGGSSRNKVDVSDL